MRGRCWPRCGGAAACSPAAARATTRRGRTAGKVTDGLFDAQTELVLSGPAAAAEDAARARRRLRRASSATTLREADPAADEALDGGAARRRATAAARRRPGGARRRPRHRPRRALPRRLRGDRRGHRARRRRDRASAGCCCASTARRRASRARARSATLALDQLSRGKLSPQAAAQAVDARTCSTPTRRGCASCSPTPAAASSRTSRRAAPRPPRRPRATSRSSRPRYAEDRGAAAEEQASAAFAALPGGDRLAARSTRRQALEGFTAAPFTPEEAARRAQQLLQFLELVPVEYGRGVKGDQVTRDFEITGGGRVPHRRRRRVRRPARPARQARPRAHRDRRRRRSTELGRLVEIAAKQQGGRADARAGRAGRRAGRPRAARPRCRRSGPRRPTSPTTT